MTPTALLRKVLAWLQAGYPKGVPPKDYNPLLAFLARGLKAEEVSEVVTALQIEHDPDHVTTTGDVREAIGMVTRSPALETDVKRIEKHLRSLGWDLEPSSEQ